MNPLAPRPLLHLEGAAVLAGSCVLYAHVQGSWIMFALLFFAPDLSMVGYQAGLRAGARAYNFIHTYTVPLVLGSAAYLLNAHVLLCLSVIWVAHIGFDRLLGFGLKYETGFKDTHLGRV